MRLRMLTCLEEQRVALQGRSILEHDRMQFSIVVIEALGSLDAQVDLIARETRAKAAVERRSVGEHDDFGAPGLQSERERDRFCAGAERGEPPVAPLPSIAVRAVKHRPAVARVEAGDARQIVDNARGDQQITRIFLASTGEHDAVAVSNRTSVGHADASEFDAVGGELTASEIVQLAGSDPVAREEAVQRPRAAITWLAEIAEQHAAAAATQHQRRAQACRTPADDDYVEHRSRAAARPSPQRSRIREELYVRLSDICLAIEQKLRSGDFIPLFVDFARFHKMLCHVPN